MTRATRRPTRDLGRARPLLTISILVVAAAWWLTSGTEALAQPADPGATVQTHHETYPNPVHDSTFRVADGCRGGGQPCPWSDPATWTAGSVPDEGTRVIVDGTVEIDDRSAFARSVGIYPGGVLSFAPSSDTELRTADLVVFSGGTLEIGTPAAPIEPSRAATVVFRDVGFDASDPAQHLRGLVALGGTVRISGSPLADVHVRSATGLAAGSASVTTTEDTFAGWQAGDAVVVPTSRQCTDSECVSEAEDRVVTGASTGSISLDAPLAFDHPGAVSHEGTLDYTPHVINKTRNVVLRSQNPNGVRGHVLFHGRADVDMRFAEVRSMGRTNIDDLGGENQKGRYPLHLHHLIGPVAPQPNGHQFTLIGNVVDFGAENATQNRKWGIAVHGSHFGLIERNVVDRASGAGIVTEDASEMGNVFRENFVVRVIGGNGARTEDLDPFDGSKPGRAGVGYWFNGGGRNTFEGNIAADLRECVYCYGFKFDNVRNGNIVFPASQGSDPYLDGGEVVAADAVGITNFSGNEAYAVPNGLTVWWACTFSSTTPNESCASTIDSFSVWHHHRWGYHGYPANNLTIAGFVVRGDPSPLTSRYEAVTGLEFSDYMHRNLTIVGADIQNVRTGIQLSSLRDLRGATGPDVGVTLIEDSYLVATEGIGVWAPASVNLPSDNLPPQTAVVRNVRFDYPAVELGADHQGHIVVRDTSVILSDDKTDYELRNDVLIENYNRAPGEDGDDLYVVPGYQSPQRCDPAVGDCTVELTAQYGDITNGFVYRLAGGAPTMGDVSCDGRVDVLDALMIAQYANGTLSDAGACPLPGGGLQLNGAVADVSGDGTVTVDDASMILECTTGLPNTLCP